MSYHVRAFKDSNSDGIGDFPGLLEKLDYLQDLSVFTCLLAIAVFSVSRLKDDGCDISDYTNIHPIYGTLDDFRAFLDAAHQRDLQVIIELVMNHTSDQHPWFEAARQAPAGSPERDFYVWSDTDQKYKDARIIFTDTERIQLDLGTGREAILLAPDFSLTSRILNYDNPRVIEEMLKIVHFWLDMGVDGLRVDAIPYLVEREGTDCENLTETHGIMKALRRDIDENYGNRMLLAEANQ